MQLSRYHSSLEIVHVWANGFRSYDCMVWLAVYCKMVVVVCRPAIMTYNTAAVKHCSNSNLRNNDQWENHLSTSNNRNSFFAHLMILKVLLHTTRHPQLLLMILLIGLIWWYLLWLCLQVEFHFLNSLKTLYSIFYSAMIKNIPPSGKNTLR